jgi:aromatic ring-opening dioxygenase LigB subunit
MWNARFAAKLKESQNIFRSSPHNTEIGQQMALLITRRRNTHNFTHKAVSLTDGVKHHTALMCVFLHF